MRRAVAVALGILLALAALEGGVRVVAPQASGAPVGLLRGPFTTPGEHRVRGPGYDVVVRVNAAGFVDREWPAPTPGGPARIVVLGDSFVQAAQVRPGEGFGPRLEAALEATGRPVDVLSMGVPGAGTGTALGVLREYALPRSPDLVVLGFLVANDVLNNHPLLEGKDDKPFYELRGGRLAPAAAEDVVAASPLWDLSAAWRWATRAWVTRRVAERKLALGQGMPIDLRVHDPACAREGGSAERCRVWDEAWAVTDALVGALVAAAGEVPVVVLLFPDRVQVERASDWPGAAGWDFDAAQARAAALAGRHAPTLDLLPGMRAAGPDLYLTEDGHWTARGHAAAAALAAPFLAERLPE